MTGVWTVFVTDEPIDRVLDHRDVDIAPVEGAGLVHYRGIPVGIQLDHPDDERAGDLGWGAHPSIVLNGDEPLGHRWQPVGEIPGFCHYGVLSGDEGAPLPALVLAPGARQLVPGIRRWSPFTLGIPAADGGPVVPIDDELAGGVTPGSVVAVEATSDRGRAALSQATVTIVDAAASSTGPDGADTNGPGPDDAVVHDREHGPRQARATALSPDHWLLVAGGPR